MLLHGGGWKLGHRWRMRHFRCGFARSDVRRPIASRVTEIVSKWMVRRIALLRLLRGRRRDVPVLFSFDRLRSKP